MRKKIRFIHITWTLKNHILKLHHITLKYGKFMSLICDAWIAGVARYTYKRIRTKLLNFSGCTFFFGGNKKLRLVTATFVYEIYETIFSLIFLMRLFQFNARHEHFILFPDFWFSQDRKKYILSTQFHFRYFMMNEGMKILNFKILLEKIQILDF